MGKESKTGTPLTLEEALSLIEKQNATIEEQNQLLEEQSKHIAKLENKVAIGNSKPSIKIGKETYSINSGARIGQTSYSPSELSENEAVCKELLKIDGQTILTIEEEE